MRTLRHEHLNHNAGLSLREWRNPPPALYAPYPAVPCYGPADILSSWRQAGEGVPIGVQAAGARRQDIAAPAIFETIGSIRSVVYLQSTAVDHIECFRKAEERERRLASVTHNEKREENSNE